MDVRPTLLLASGLIAAGLLTPTAASALTISGTKVKTLPDGPSSSIAADGRTTDVIYYLDLHASPTGDRFSIELRPGRFATRGGRDEGRAIDGPAQVTLYGPGTVGEVVSDPAFAPLCSSTRDRFHGYATGDAKVDVHLPPNADTTVAIRYETGRKRLWDDTDLRLRFGFSSSLVGSYAPDSPLFGPATSVAGANTLSRTPRLDVRGRGSKGKIGAHMVLKTTPSGTWGEDDGTPRTVRRSTRIRVAGTLYPKLRRKRVQLQWARTGGKLRTARTVRTDSKGRFRATLRPPGRGTWELWAKYPRQSGPLAQDTTSCPVRYRVR